MTKLRRRRPARASRWLLTTLFAGALLLAGCGGGGDDDDNGTAQITPPPLGPAGPSVTPSGGISGLPATARPEGTVPPELGAEAALKRAALQPADLPGSAFTLRQTSTINAEAARTTADPAATQRNFDTWGRLLGHETTTDVATARRESSAIWHVRHNVIAFRDENGAKAAFAAMTEGGTPSQLVRAQLPPNLSANPTFEPVSDLALGDERAAWRLRGSYTDPAGAPAGGMLIAVRRAQMIFVLGVTGTEQAERPARELAEKLDPRMNSALSLLPR